MGRFFSFCILLFAFGTASGQDTGKHTISLGGLIGSNVMGVSGYVGTGSYDGKGYSGLSLEYAHRIARPLELVTGIWFTDSRIETAPSFYPETDMTPTRHRLQLLAVPVGVKIGFLRYFFINGGGVGFLDLKNSRFEQTGLSWTAGLGCEYFTRKGIRLFMNPYFAGPVTAEHRYLRNYNAGLKLGAGYRF